MARNKTKGLNRRTFLSGTATIAAASVSQNLMAQPDNKQQDNKNAKFDYDVIIIGGGFAGATAARELGRQGYRTLVLEARSRLGGRTLTSQFVGRDIEYGGAWIHWMQPHVWAEMRRYNLDVVEEPVTNIDRTLLMDNDGAIKDINPDKFWIDFQDAFEKFCHDSREIFPRPYTPLHDPRVRELDKHSVLGRINELDISEDQYLMLKGFMTLYGGGKTSEFGLPGMLKLYACGGWNYGSFFDAESHYRIEGGTIALVNALMKDSGAEIKLATPVTRVEQSENGAKVFTDDDQIFTSSSVLMTIPINTYQYIDFFPSLSTGKQDFYSEGQLSQGCKLYVHIKENLGNIFALADEEQPLNWVQTHESSDELGTILSITVAQRSNIDINDDEIVKSEVMKMFPGVNVLSSVAYDWPNDPFSMGAWPAYRVGQQSKINILQQPENRLFFAGAATANGWHEFIDGAVESGLRSGQQIHDFLKQSSL